MSHRAPILVLVALAAGCANPQTTNAVEPAPRAAAKPADTIVLAAADDSGEHIKLHVTGMT